MATAFSFSLKHWHSGLSTLASGKSQRDLGTFRWLTTVWKLRVLLMHEEGLSIIWENQSLLLLVYPEGVSNVDTDAFHPTINVYHAWCNVPYCLAVYNFVYWNLTWIFRVRNRMSLSTMFWRSETFSKHFQPFQTRCRCPKSIETLLWDQKMLHSITLKARENLKIFVEKISFSCLHQWTCNRATKDAWEIGLGPNKMLKQVGIKKRQYVLDLMEPVLSSPQVLNAADPFHEVLESIYKLFEVHFIASRVFVLEQKLPNCEC